MGSLIIAMTRDQPFRLVVLFDQSRLPLSCVGTIWLSLQDALELGPHAVIKLIQNFEFSCQKGFGVGAD